MNLIFFAAVNIFHHFVHGKYKPVCTNCSYDKIRTHPYPPNTLTLS